MKYLIFEQKSNHTGMLKIHRPEALNALNSDVLNELLAFFQDPSHRERLKGLVMTGSGEKAFIAGADIKEMQGMDHFQMHRFCELGQRVADSIAKAPFVTLAAVNGYALGGGLEMALACDFIYAVKSAKLGLPEVSLGIIPGFGGTQRLSRVIGTKKAKECVLTGRTFTADEAKELGIVNKVCEIGQLEHDCLSVMGEITKHSKTALIQAKRVIDIGSEIALDAALELERDACALCFSTSERAEAMDAFLDRSAKARK